MEANFLRSRGKRSVGLFGVKIIDNKLLAEIAFFDRNISEEFTLLTNEDFTDLTGYRLRIPSHYRDLNRPTTTFNFSGDIECDCLN